MTNRIHGLYHEAMMHSTRINAINMSSFPTSSPTIVFTADMMGNRRVYTEVGNCDLDGETSATLTGADTRGGVIGWRSIDVSCEEECEGEIGLMHVHSQEGQSLFDFSHCPASVRPPQGNTTGTHVCQMGITECLATADRFSRVDGRVEAIANDEHRMSINCSETAHHIAQSVSNLSF